MRLTKLEKGAIIVTMLFLAFTFGVHWGSGRIRDSFAITTQQDSLSAQVGTERMMPEVQKEPEEKPEPTVSASAVPETPAPDSPAVPDGKVNINTAGVEELTRLKGIGQALAGRIVAYREENGPFSSVEEITRVSGIGEGTLEDIRDEITVG